MPSSEPKPLTLEQWLGRCYGAPHGYAPATSVDDFAKALQSDSDLVAAANAKLAQLEALADVCGGDIGKRCTLSQAAIDTLRAVLK